MTDVGLRFRDDDVGCWAVLGECIDAWAGVHVLYSSLKNPCACRYRHT